MGNLSANAPRQFVQGETNGVPVKASTEIWCGSAVGMTSGYARMLVSGDVFAGFAESHINNTVATDGASSISVRRSGTVLLTFSSVAVTDIGAAVYATDGNTFVLTSGGTYIGRVTRYVSATTAEVSFNCGSVG